MQPIEETVVMWGPTGAGKTSLFYAFLKKLERLSILSKDFFFEALDLQSGFPFDNNIGKYGIEATDVDISDDLLSIKRIPKIKSVENELSCSFVHKVHIQDYAGKYSIAATVDPYKVLSSNNFILALDSYKGFDYQRHLANLHQRLLNGQNDNTQIRIAVCVTKIDLDEDGVLVTPAGQIIMNDSDLDAYITRHFGIEVKTSLDMFAADDRFVINKFLTSAVGFYYDGEEDQRMSNYLITNQTDAFDKVEGSQKWLKDEKKWNPVGVADPFFWIFTLSEKKILEKRKKTFEFLWTKKEIDNYKPWSGT